MWPHSLSAMRKACDWFKHSPAWPQIKFSCSCFYSLQSLTLVKSQQVSYSPDNLMDIWCCQISPNDVLWDNLNLTGILQLTEIKNLCCLVNSINRPNGIKSFSCLSGFKQSLQLSWKNYKNLGLTRIKVISADSSIHSTNKLLPSWIYSHRVDRRPQLQGKIQINWALVARAGGSLQKLSR